MRTVHFGSRSSSAQSSSQLVTQQEACKQDSELGLGAQKNTRGEPVKN
jgi:hypothetical protein